ncbi:MAG: RnfABCDGE type electron transport complex subunit G [Epsilonproteobacteria bacterium]|nr:MAG: RnfABCDGE type electron transport complex subunit G [Campylobacterota bacterium]
MVAIDQPLYETPALRDKIRTMAKKESSLLNMIVGLGGVALIASALLGGVYAITKEPIELAKAKKLKEAIQLVTPEFDNDPAAEMYMLPVENNDSLICYPTRIGGELVATAIKTYSDNGFSGRFYIMVGLDKNGTIINTAVLEHAETPGLGDKIEKKKSDWSDQFNDKNPETSKIKVTKDGGDIDGITASTITSRAFCEAVQQAFETYKKEGKHE